MIVPWPASPNITPKRKGNVMMVNSAGGGREGGGGTGWDGGENTVGEGGGYMPYM